MRPLDTFTQDIINLLKKYNQETKAKGLIPTIELLIEDLGGSVEQELDNISNNTFENPAEEDLEKLAVKGAEDKKYE